MDVDFLKIGRHGSGRSSTVAFLDAVGPETAAITAGTATLVVGKSEYGFGSAVSTLGGSRYGRTKFR